MVSYKDDTFRLNGYKLTIPSCSCMQAVKHLPSGVSGIFWSIIFSTSSVKKMKKGKLKVILVYKMVVVITVGGVFLLFAFLCHFSHHLSAFFLVICLERVRYNLAMDLKQLKVHHD
jgi:hypothetical protein